MSKEKKVINKGTYYVDTKDLKQKEYIQRFIVSLIEGDEFYKPKLEKKRF